MEERDEISVVGIKMDVEAEEPGKVENNDAQEVEGCERCWSRRSR
jgi:hypothetical protein